ncbi:hypothetical protein STRSA0001_1955 [Streptococcus salivarius SK126]|nr:hypothetical protein STRSA0001_1955 [Streptococcus salivarius SK126]
MVKSSTNIMTTLSKLQNIIKKTSPHGKVAQKITGEPCCFTLSDLLSLSGLI